MHWFNFFFLRECEGVVGRHYFSKTSFKMRDSSKKEEVQNNIHIQSLK